MSNLNVIWKFPLRSEDTQVVMMPTRAEILTVQMQDGVPTIWALVDPTANREQVKIIIVGTGRLFDTRDLHYLGTVQEPIGLVWHIFMEVEP